MVRNFIDHQRTSANQSQADGPTERFVQTVKRSICKNNDDQQTLTTWNEHLSYLQLGSNVFKPESSEHSPYHLLSARESHFQSGALTKQMKPPLSFDTLLADKASRELARHSAMIRVMVPLITARLDVAQQHDKLQYAQIHFRTNPPFDPLVDMRVDMRRLRNVYMRRPNQVKTLQMQAQQLIVRITKVKSKGMIVVMGRCGNT